MGYLVVFIVGLVFGLIFGYTVSALRQIKTAKPEEGDYPDGALRLNPDGALEVKVVGESHYQDNLLAICGKRTTEGVQLSALASLVLESSNPYDPEAVRVDIEDNPVGYLSRSAASEFRKRITETGVRHRQFECEALITGRWERGRGDTGSFGVKVYLPAP